jgi:hypothetical protein
VGGTAVALKLCLLYMFYIYIFVTLGQQSLAALASSVSSVSRTGLMFAGSPRTLHISKVNVSHHGFGGPPSRRLMFIVISFACADHVANRCRI